MPSRCRLVALASIVCAATVWAAPALAAPPEGKTWVNAAGMTFVRIEPGEFVMGAGEAGPKTRDEWLARDADEAPAHRVRIARAFYLGAHEVTQQDYARFDPEHRAKFAKLGGTKGDRDPVTFVTWQQAVDFCRWLSEKEGQPYRLPTEAEWEYACRAGTTGPFSTGENLSPEQAHFGKSRDGKNRSEPMAVGSYAANPWGLFDLHGNVAEWCHDWYAPYPADAQTTLTDPVGPAAGYAASYARVVRGWSCLGAMYQPMERFCRSANRAGHLPDDANRFTGFRVVLGELPATAPAPATAPPLHQQNVAQTPAPREGPPADQPYFVDFKREKKQPTIPRETWGPIFSQHNHFSSLCVCPNGDVLAVWYTCYGESDRQLAQAASRLRAGRDQWEPCSLFFGVPDVNCHAPVLLTVGPRIYHFATQSLRGWDDASNIMRTSDDSGATWSAPRVILPRHDAQRLSQPCSAIRTADGKLVLACDGDSHRDERLMVSGDEGRTWTVAAGDMRKSHPKQVIHPAIYQQADGAIVALLRGPDPMPALFTRNLGATWETRDALLPGINVGCKTSALKLASGALVVLSLDLPKKFGGGSFVALSTDDGRTWAHVRKLEAPVGGYTSLAQAPNGVIYLAGSQLGVAACNEAWIKQGAAGPGAR